jgi:hypothetical protein
LSPDEAEAPSSPLLAEALASLDAAEAASEESVDEEGADAAAASSAAAGAEAAGAEAAGADAAGADAAGAEAAGAESAGAESAVDDAADGADAAVDEAGADAAEASSADAGAEAGLDSVELVVLEVVAVFEVSDATDVSPGCVSVCDWGADCGWDCGADCCVDEGCDWVWVAPETGLPSGPVTGPEKVVPAGGAESLVTELLVVLTPYGPMWPLTEVDVAVWPGPALALVLALEFPACVPAVAVPPSELELE